MADLKLMVLVCCVLILLISEIQSDATTKENTKSSDCPRLNKFITCYSPAQVIHHKKDGRNLELLLKAFNRSIALEMHAGDDRRSVISPNMKINIYDEHGKHEQPAKTSDYYYGHMKGYPDSTSAHGRFNGVTFAGTVRNTKGAALSFELAKRYFNRSELAADMIAYRDIDLDPVYGAKIVQQSNFSNLYADAHAEPRADHRNDSRHSRQTSNNERRICVVKAYVDHTFYDSVRVPAGEEDFKIQYVQADVVYHIQESHEIFRRTDFNGDSAADNIEFSIEEIRIFATPDADGYLLASVTPSANDLLIAFTTYDFDNLCLGFLFVRRDFERGVIGLAWTANSNLRGAAGGICQRRFSRRSYNTLLLTTVNYGTSIPRRVNALTAVHEFGHSFGSGHDQAGNGMCTPGGSQGNYIMSPTASNADKPNNDDFSPCSISAINPVILNKGPICFVTGTTNLCGNFVIDAGEECDCGPNAAGCRDPCCVATTCRLQNNVVCSPQASPCCTSSCVAQTDTSVVCREADECTAAATCNGGLECPPPTAINEGGLCYFGQRRCSSGNCDVSRCADFSTTECFCNDNAGVRCDLCCLDPADGACNPIEEIDPNIDDPISLQAGDRCYEGYCDDQLNCVYSASNDILDSLDMGLSRTPYQQLADFMSDYWFLVAFLVVLLVLLIGVAIAWRLSAKVGSIGHHTRDEITSLVQEADEVILEFDKLVANMKAVIDKRTERMERLPHETKSITRLKAYFPFTDPEDLEHVKRTTNDEMAAIEMLIRHDHPMLQLPESESVTSYELTSNILL